MERQLELYNRILFLDLRPWKQENDNDSWYIQLLNDTPSIFYSVQPNFEIRFPKPLLNIHKYYVRIIENEAILFLNYLHDELHSSMNDFEKTYFVHVAITRNLYQKLAETRDIISERNYSAYQITIANNFTPDELARSTESYILHYLKHELVRLILEVQVSFPEYLKDEPLSEEEIYLKYFRESAPEQSFIIKARDFPNTKHTISVSQKPEPEPFHAIQNDFRNEKKGILSYKDLIKNSSRFAQTEEDLFRNGYINKDYEFVNKHGQKQYLSAFYHQLIRKGYFNKYQFPGKKTITSLSIRKFLDYRYNANLDKQFRMWDNNEPGLLKFIERDFFLDHIPSC